jgi:hypothetical protein
MRFPKAPDDLFLDPHKLGGIGDNILAYMDGLTAEEAKITLAIVVRVFLEQTDGADDEQIDDFGNHVRFVRDRKVQG